MTEKYIYRQGEISNDNIFFIAEKLYKSRLKKQLSLKEVSRLTEIPLPQIDALECMLSEINFLTIAKLLDVYQTTLNFGPYFCMDLPEAYRNKYFSY